MEWIWKRGKGLPIVFMKHELKYTMSLTVCNDSEPTNVATNNTKINSILCSVWAPSLVFVSILLYANTNFQTRK